MQTYEQGAVIFQNNEPTKNLYGFVNGEVNLKQVFSKDQELGYLLSSRISSIIANRLNCRTEKLVDAWCSLFETERIGVV